MEWTHVIAVFAVMVTNLGTIISLYIQTDSKLEAHRSETSQILQGIALEMKDFHGRLCAIEERNKK